MKKLLTILVIAMLVLSTAAVLAACDDTSDTIGSGITSGDIDSGDIGSGDGTDEPQISVTGIVVDGDIIDNNVLVKGSEIEGLEFVIKYSDGSKSEAKAVDDSMISGFDKDKTGYQTVKVSYEDFEYEFEVLVADVIIAEASELQNAIKTQQDGQTWAIMAGEYDIAPDDETVVEGETGWYFALTADDLSIYGVGMPIITSSVNSINGNWSKQNLITVFGNNVVIDGVNIISKIDVNKIIEVVGGDNFVLSNSAINPPYDNPKFAGSIYFNEYAGKTATLENVDMNYARISTSGCDSTSTINLKNVDIEFAGAYDKNFEEAGYSAESYYWAIFNTSDAKINAQSTTITVSVGASKHNEYESWFLAYLPDVGIEINIVEVWNEENVSYVSNESQLEQAVQISANYSAYTIIFDEDINWTKSGSTVFDVDGVTISLNGKTLSLKNMAVIFQGNDLTIKDGTVSVTDGGNYALFVGDEEYTTGVVVENVVLNGGINAYNTSVTLKDCTITGTKYYAIWCDTNAQVTVESGKYAVSADGKNVIGMGVPGDDYIISLTINGGEFVSENGNLVLTGNEGGLPYGSPVINAGIFSENPEAYVAETSEIKEEGGKYIVVVK